MIIIKSPLRLSLGGGGTDLPSYYKIDGGFFISAAINKHIYIAIHDTFSKELLLKYSEYEEPESIQIVKHPIIREAIKMFYKKKPGLEITSFADIPGGTGLGSSSSFCNALVMGLAKKVSKNIADEVLAKMSCEIEIEKLKEPIGIQDQYISALGGMKAFEISKEGIVTWRDIYKKASDIADFENNFALISVGGSRSAGSILSQQDKQTQAGNNSMINNLNEVKEMGREFFELLIQKDFDEYGRLMHKHWELKKQRSKVMSNEHIDEIYEFCILNGSNGGKLIGAGAGGFLFMHCSNKEDLSIKLSKKNIKCIDFKFEQKGTHLIDTNV